MLDINKLGGVYVPHLVPLNDDCSINIAELRHYVDWMLDRGVNGFFTNGSTGEFLRYTPEEQIEITRTVAEQNSLSKNPAVVLSVICDLDPRRAIEHCKRYRDVGADGAGLLPPIYYKLTPEAVYAYIAEVAKKACLPLVLYQIPQFANAIGPELVERLVAEFPGIVGIKDSSADISAMVKMAERVRRLRPDFRIFTGAELALFPMMAAGANGGINAISGLVPNCTTKMCAAFDRGDYAEAQRLQYALVDLVELLRSLEFPDGYRLALRLQGIKAGPSRQPYSLAMKASFEAARNKLQEILGKLNEI